jgi:hypothetical protein
MSDQKRTQFAIKAVSFAELFNTRVGGQKVRGTVEYRVEMSAPDGPSTGGGLQAVQHVKLIPQATEGAAGAVIVAGWVNPFEKAAELRSYEYLSELHAQRWRGADLLLDRTGYGDLVKRMQAFFDQEGLRVVLLDSPRPATSGGAASSSQAASRGAFVAILVMGLLLIVGALFLFLRK